MMRCSFLLLLAPVAAIGACTPVDTGFGEAFRWNNAQQTVNLEPVQRGPQVEGGSGQRSAAAVDRYEKGEVKEPVSLQTTMTVSGGSSPR
jgi:hypothetical protein